MYLFTNDQNNSIVLAFYFRYTNLLIQFGSKCNNIKIVCGEHSSVILKLYLCLVNPYDDFSEGIMQ